MRKMQITGVTHVSQNRQWNQHYLPIFTFTFSTAELMGWVRLFLFTSWSISGSIADRETLRSFPTSSLFLLLVFSAVRAENVTSHRYVVAKGIRVFVARLANCGNSELRDIQNVSIDWERNCCSSDFEHDSSESSSDCPKVSDSLAGRSFSKGFRIQS